MNKLNKQHKNEGIGVTTEQDKSPLHWPAAIAKSLVKLIYYSGIPKNRTGDRIISLVSFLRAHKRFPRSTLKFNDLWFKIKTSDEILEPGRVFTSDKELAKLYIKAVVGERYIVKTYGVIRNEIELGKFKFPDRCVIKPTHASGCVIIKTDNLPVNIELLSTWLRLDYYNLSREANYRYLKPKIIVEELVFDRAFVDDIKFFCAFGIVKLIQWDFDRHTNHTRKLFDREWNDLHASVGYPLSTKTIDKPINLGAMIEVAERIAAIFNYVRVDMFTNLESGEFYVGEITHCHGNSIEKFNPPESEEQINKTLFS